jgi:hypothetical protein
MPLASSFRTCFPIGYDVAADWYRNSWPGFGGPPTALPYVSGSASGLRLEGYQSTMGIGGGSEVWLELDMPPLGIPNPKDFDLTESHFAVGWSQFVAPAISPYLQQGETTMIVELNPGYCEVRYWPDRTAVAQLHFEGNIGGVAYSFERDYSGEQHWRVRHSGTTVYVETSTDPVGTRPAASWLIRHSGTHLTGVTGAWLYLSSESGTSVVDYVNGCASAQRARAFLLT